MLSRHRRTVARILTTWVTVNTNPAQDSQNFSMDWEEARHALFVAEELLTTGGCWRRKT